MAKKKQKKKKRVASTSNVSYNFSELKNALERRNSTIRTALENYRTQAARITARYSEAVAAEELAKAQTTARVTIEAADESAHDAAERVVAILQGKLSEHIAADADAGLLAKLQAAQSFGLKLTRSEVEAMAKKANGDPVVLACLEQVAKTSGYSLTYTSMKQMEDDLKKIMSLFNTPSFYTDEEYFHEAMICHPNRRHNGVDFGRPDATAITIGMGLGKAAPRDLEQIAERWNDANAVTIKQIAPVY